MTTRDDPELVRATVAYVERLFGPGSGERHVRFLDRIENPALREMIHRYHPLEGDTSLVSLEENYLLGMCVLAALGRYDTASMFAKTLLHLGTPREKLLEALARLAMWVGGLPAAEATFAIQRAIREYERDGVQSLGTWFPRGEGG